MQLNGRDILNHTLGIKLMTETDPEQQDFIDRAPVTLWETLHTNCRPQPAIPSVLIFLLFVLLPIFSNSSQGDGANWLWLLVAAGIVGSCGLAVAAGFCSVFPQMIWIVIAGWCLTLPDSAALPLFNRILLVIGILLASAMLAHQIRRVRTGKFIPTIREYKQDSDQ
jgi:hypothetical protein